jgi:peptidoglycan L-alanyl-D-glutamate endopeptidase CwlK
MADYRFSERSAKALVGVHADLVAVIALALSRSPIDFGLTEGLRTKERQAELVKSGASQTMNSRHLTGHAVDVVCYVDGKVRWDWPLYEKLSETVKACARELKVPITWGGDWKSLRDGPHYELDRGVYPADGSGPPPAPVTCETCGRPLE